MISTIFDTEKDQMRTIIHASQVIQNFTYKITHDLNSTAFFKNVIENIKSYSSLERMEKYYFENDLKEMREVLHLLYRSLQADSIIKNKTAEELVRCCNIFPDNIGKRTIILISYIPILDLFYEDLQYQEYFKNRWDLEKNMMGQTILEDQNDRLFGDSIFNKKFPKEDEFTDYNLRNKFVDKLEAEYKNGRQEEIKNGLNILLAHYGNKEDTDEVTVTIGSAYWEQKKKVRSEESKAFSDLINSMSKALKSKGDK